MSWLSRKWNEYKEVLKKEGQTQLDEFEVYIKWADKKIEHDLKEIIEELKEEKDAKGKAEQSE